MNLQDVRYDPGDAYWEKGPRVREYHEERAAQGLVTLYEAALPPAPRVEPTVQSPAPPLAPPPPVAPKAVAPPKNFPIVSPSVVAADTSAQRVRVSWLAGWTAAHPLLSFPATTRSKSQCLLATRKLRRTRCRT